MILLSYKPRGIYTFLEQVTARARALHPSLTVKYYKKGVNTLPINTCITFHMMYFNNRGPTGGLICQMA